MYDIIFYDKENGDCPVYFFLIGEKAVITNGFVKKTNHIPKRELELAKKYKEDFERRHINE